jgi:hypothetical protein
MAALDAWGHRIVQPGDTLESFGIVDETTYKLVVRGGQKMKLPLVRRKRKKRLTPSQRAGIRKAVRTKKTAGSKRKLARSLKLRKRMKLKPRKNPRGFRVGS